MKRLLAGCLLVLSLAAGNLSAETDSNFAKALPVLANKQESLHSRQQTLEKLKSSARRLKTSERKELLHNYRDIAKDETELPAFSAQATRAMASISVMMLEKGEITRDEATSDKAFLMDVAADKGRDLQLRASSIKAIEVLKINEAVPVLESLLSDSNNFDEPEIARSASLSLTRLSGPQAFPYIRKVSKHTTNAHVFETTAYCLGQMKTVEAMVELEQNSGRFADTGASDFALVEMEDVITDVLKQPHSADAVSAIRATKSLWKNGQKEKYMPLLYSLLTPATELATRQEAVKRLIHIAEQMPYGEEKKELSKTLLAIKDMADMKEYSEEIQKRLNSRLLTS